MTPTRHLQQVRDLRIARTAPLIAPEEVLADLPLTDDQAEVVLRGREQISAIIDRADDRLDGSGDVNAGVRMARGLLLDVLALGVPVAVEWLDPVTPQYISDTVAWGAIGARTAESQTHRQLGSGLSMPVGVKNRTDGNVQVAVDAVRAAAVPHAFAGIDMTGTPAILHTHGNGDCHVILRGGRDAPNHTSSEVAAALAKLDAAALPGRVVIDASHDNSGKDHD